MSETYDLILQGGRVVNHDGMGEADIAIRDGRIVEIGQIPASKAAQTLALQGLHVLPGVIDTQVHFREPGNEHKEDLETGSRAAVMGGVTGVFEMPNTNPPTTTIEALQDKVARARNRMFCDFAFYVGGTRENVAQLPVLERLEGVAGVKVFMGSSTGDLLVDDDPSVARILRAISRRAAFHAEDEPRLKARLDRRVQGDPASHPVWRDAEAARLCTKRLIRIARETGKQIHILHISTAEEWELLAANKDLVSVEVTPQHLTFAAPEAYDRLGTRAQMNPPIRGNRHRTKIWWGLRSGVADILGSDHAPHTLEEKANPYPASPSGMPGVQTLVPVMLNHVNAGHLSLQRFVDMTSHGPQRLFDIVGKGRIAVGYDADFTIVDMNETRLIEDSWSQSRCGWTPYAGMKVKGWPKGTIIRGRRVMWEDEILGPAHGQPIRFQQTLKPR